MRRRAPRRKSSSLVRLSNYVAEVKRPLVVLFPDVTPKREGWGPCSHHSRPLSSMRLEQWASRCACLRWHSSAPPSSGAEYRHLLESAVSSVLLLPSSTACLLGSLRARGQPGETAHRLLVRSCSRGSTRQCWVTVREPRCSSSRRRRRLRSSETLLVSQHDAACPQRHDGRRPVRADAEVDQC